MNQVEYGLATLANGLRLVTVEMPHLHRVEMACLVGVGSRFEAPETAGISHFLEHLLFRGSTAHPRGSLLEQAFERLGGAVNAATDAETTWIHSRFSPTHVKAGVALLADMLRRPVLRDLAIERQVILAEVLEDFNEAGEDVNPDNRMSRLLWPGHPLSRPTAGTPDSVEAIDRDRILQHHAAFYRPDNLVLAAAGKIRSNELLKMTEQFFGDWPSAPGPVPAPEAWPGSPGREHPSPAVWVRDSSAQVHLQLTFPVPGRHSSQAIPLRVIQRLLSAGATSRLVQRLREHLGLTYHVEAGLSLFRECGCLSVDLAVAPDQLLQALRELRQIFRRLRRQQAPRAELQRLVRGVLFDLEFVRDHPEDLAMRYGWGESVGNPRLLDDDRRDFSAVTAEQLQETAATLFTSEAVKMVVVGPYRDRDRLPAEKILADFVPA